MARLKDWALRGKPQEEFFGMLPIDYITIYTNFFGPESTWDFIKRAATEVNDEAASMHHSIMTR